MAEAGGHEVSASEEKGGDDSENTSLLSFLVK